MRKTIILALLVVILLGTTRLYAVTEWTYGDHTVGSGDTYDIVKIYNDVTLSILDGGQIGGLETYDITLTEMFGGALDTLLAYEESRVHLRGGDIGTVIARADEVVHIYGLEFEWTPEEFNPARGVLTGLWEDNTPFSINLRDCPPSSGKVVLHVIPEPATLLLMGLGGLLCRKQLHKTGDFNIIVST